MRRRWLLATLWLLLPCIVGCMSFRKTPVPLADSELPIKVSKGQTVTVPFDGYYMQTGAMLHCYRECAERAVHGR